MKAITNKRAACRSWTVRAALALGVLAAALMLGPPAQSEPYMTVREGYKCSKCHVNKTGGGMRTDYAKVYLDTRNSIWPGFGAGASQGPSSDLPSGRLSPYFSLGADLRADLTYTHREHEHDHAEFLHASTDATGGSGCATCHTASQGGGKRAEIYGRLEMQPDVASFVVSESLSPVVAPREIYGLLDSLPGNGYVKAGIFRLPTDFNNTFDEPFYHTNQATGATIPTVETVRGTGVEVGFEPGPISASLSITNPADLSKVNKAKRVLANVYVVGSLGAVGVTGYKDPISDTKTSAEYHSLQGLYGGLSLGRVTVLLEVDDLKEHLTTGDTKQRTGLAQVDFLITKGQNFKYQYEYIDPDRTVEKDKRDRSSFIYEPFLTPYLQTRVGYRLLHGPSQANPATPDKNNGKQVFIELHFIY